MAQFVLHAHMPYVLDTSVEYWLHEAVFNCYLPLIDMLENSISAKIVIHISPTILVQCSRQDFLDKYKHYCDTRLSLASLIPYEELRNKELNRIHCYSDASTMISRFTSLQKNGKIRILTGLATHPFPPLLSEEEVNLHARIGVEISRYFFGDISGVWTPECGLTAEICSALSQSGFLYTYADPSCTRFSTNRVICQHLKLFIRDIKATNLIWDNESGYPGHSNYQDFHTDFSLESPEAKTYLHQRDILRAGFSLRRIGNRKSSDKPLYDLSKAKEQSLIDANSFINNLSGNEILTFDAELFGHWWHEGIDFLKELFDLAPQGFFQFPEEDNEACLSRDILPSTWGTMSDSSSWINDKTAIFLENMQLPKNASAYEMRARMLSQASDWLFLITHDSFRGEAESMILNLRKEAPIVDDIFTKFLTTNEFSLRNLTYKYRLYK